MYNNKAISSPMTSATILSWRDDIPFLDGTECRSTVGALQYYILTRPNISFVVNKVYKYMHYPIDIHW